MVKRDDFRFRKALAKAIAILGTQEKLASEANKYLPEGITPLDQGRISHMKNRQKSINPIYANAFEKATKRLVKNSEFCPEVFKDEPEVNE